jgi:quercetin 2,3-dioxygenase
MAPARPARRAELREVSKEDAEMIILIKSDDRYHAERGWLDTRWHFSFDDYYDPANMNWGPLRVFNDDLIQPASGFGFHPHRDMEIITYVISGELEHRDNKGNQGVIQPGEVQVMSAGTGIVHSEYNHSKEKPLRLLQLWISPRTKGLKPRWEQRVFGKNERLGKLLPVVSSGSLPETLHIDQDASIYVSTLNKGQEVVHRSAPGRKGYLFVISGSVTLGATLLANGDQARLSDETELKIKAAEDSELIFLDLAPGVCTPSR